MVRRYSPSPVGLFESLVGLTATHVRRLGGWEQADIRQCVDLLFVGRLGLGRGIDVLQTLAFNLLDGINNPSTLNLDCCWAIAQQCWSPTMRQLVCSYRQNHNMQDMRE